MRAIKGGGVSPTSARPRSVNELATIRAETNVEAYRASTEAAALCREIVIATSSSIQGRAYVSVEGWQAIARAHGCAAGARDVEKVEGGVRAIGEVRDIHTGALVATAEGFVGEDEPTWFGGQSRGKTLPKRADYAIRAMAQTRAMSRACRSAFAHVVIMMKAGLQTTPLEEVPHEGFDRETGEIIEAVKEPAAREKLDGPHTSKTALRKAVNDIITAVRKVESLEELESLKKEHKRTINQALRDWPALVDGDPNIAEDVGLKGAIELKRAELTRSTEYQFLVSCVSECTSSQELRSFLNQHADAIGDLDGEEARDFEARYDEKFAALKLLDETTVGA
jgi:hypothetical protein